MQTSRRVVTIVISIVAAFFIASSTITQHFFPYTGLSLSLMVLSSIIIYFKSPKDKVDWSLFSLSLPLAFFISFRADSLLTFFNVLATVFIISYLTLRRSEEHHNSFMVFLTSPFKAILHTLEAKFAWKLPELRRPTLSPKVQVVDLTRAFVSVGITGLLLLIVLPLLASANPFFADALKNIFDLITFSWLWQLIEQLQIGPNLPIQVVLFVVLFLALPKLTAFVRTNSHEPSSLEANFPLLLPKMVLIGVIAFFLFTQLQLYLASTETLAALGYTNSQQTREIFAQLSIVSAIIFAIIYNDRSHTSSHRQTSVVLMIEAFFLILMALRSDFDYIAQFGLTHRRLWGLMMVTWIAGVFGFYAYAFMKSIAVQKIVNPVIFFSAGLLIFVNVLNFDALIYHLYPPHYGDHLADHEYILKLSPDGQFYGQELLYVQSVLNSPDKQEGYEIGMKLLSKIEVLKEKYQHPEYNWRSFNFSEYRQYQQVKSVKVNQLRSQLHDQIYSQ